MTTDEYLALRRFCDRYPELTPERRHKLVMELLVPLARKYQIEDSGSGHSIELAEAVVMKYGRQHGLL
jgi:hypothetical protein